MSTTSSDAPRLAPADPTPSAPPRAVLFFSHILHLGGVSTHMAALGEGLMRRGIRVGIAARYLSPGYAFGVEFFRSRGFEIFEVDFAGYGASPSTLMRTIRSARQVRRIAETFRPDIVHVHAPTLCLVARLAGLPYVTTFNIRVDGERKRRIARLATRLMPTALGRVAIAISAELERDLLDGMGLPPSVVRRTVYTIDESGFAPATPDARRAARAHYGLDDDALVVCMLAHVEPRKNHELLIDALALAKARGRKVVALMAGGDFEDRRAALQARIDAAGIGDVARLMHHEPARRLYDASDAYVLPSLYEGFPLSTIEAMHSGLVPIRTPCEGAAEQIVDGESGYLVPFHEPAVLADRLVALADDPSLRRCLGDAARVRARDRYAVETMVDQTLAAYRDALA